MKKILITGATGFIGGALLKHLQRESGNDIIIHAVHLSSHREQVENVRWHRLDLLNRDDRKKLFDEVRPTHLIHLAWCAEHGKYWKDPANLDWATATMDMARLFRENGGERCLFAGTSAEYDWSGKVALHESLTPLKPQFLYGGCKLGVYWALHEYFKQEEISWTWARFFNPFGPGEDSRRLIPKTFSRILNNEILKFDAALSMRDFLYIDDVADALATLLFSDVQGPVNIGSGEVATVREIITIIAELCRRPESIYFEERKNNNALPDMVVADVQKLHEHCNWKPSKTLKQGLEETHKWLYQNNNK